VSPTALCAGQGLTQTGHYFFYLLLMFDLNVEIGDKIDVYNISAMEWSFCYTRCVRKRGLCRRAVSVWLAGWLSVTSLSCSKC